MRFAEFKLFEAQGGVYVAVGDSHAHAVAQMGGKAWLNLAVPGASSKGTHPKIQQMLANISKIPKGSVVIVALGANDTANAMAALTGNTTKQPRAPSSIASDVASVIAQVKAQGPSKVIFLLFPNGPGRGPKGSGAEFYGGKYQDDVRAAIKSAVGVPVIDINGKPLTDGVHATMGVYKEVANEVTGMAKPQATVPTSGIAPKPADDKNNIGTNSIPGKFQIAVPDTSVGWKGAGVMDVQKALMALGYDLGPRGADGIRGKFTIAAINKYQADRNLKVDGDAGPETVTALNKDIVSNPTKFTGITQSKPEEVKQSAKVGQTYSVQPVEYDAVTTGKIGEVLNFVAAPESRGYYDMMFGGSRKPEILKMTIQQANQFQNVWGKQAGSSAMGRYQIMHFNTIDYARKAGLDPNKALFSPENQDKMGIIFLREKGLDSWLAGKMKDQTFLEGLARVWAGLPAPSKGGNSYYGGVGLNRAKTQITMNTAIDSLQNIRQA
jgi:muramidase (phage lysozyme)/lysophospholipase L1-like esterase